MASQQTDTAGTGEAIDIRQAFLSTNYVIATKGTFPSRNLSSDPLIGSVAMFGGSFAPTGWEFCEGQSLKISDYPDLFKLIGTTYGGDGQTTFNLPDLVGRVPIGVGSGPGLDPIELGGVYGSETTTLPQAPEHHHSTDGTSTGSSGGEAKLATTMPSLGLTPVVATQGIYPPRNLSTEPAFGDIAWFAGDDAPQGWSTASGQLLPIAQNQALFSLLGTNYGGDGRTTFALPDLRGRIAIGAGRGRDMSAKLGQRGGQLEQPVTLAQTPSHQHNEPDGDVTGDVTGKTGESTTISIDQPWLAVNYQVALYGDYPPRSLQDNSQSNGAQASTPERSQRFLDGERSLNDRQALRTINPLLTATRTLWEQAGASQRQLKILDAASIQLADLDSTGLAEVRSRNVIHLDRDAQGRGWYIDRTPLSDREYNSTDPATGAAAAQQGPAARHYDLLTTLLHEQAHLLGVNHVDRADDLMHGGLSIGIRKMPGQHHVQTPGHGKKPQHNHPHALSAFNSYIGSIGMSGINYAPQSTALAQGQFLSIEYNTALYSIFGTAYGGDGRMSFGLPDFRGRAAVGAYNYYIPADRKNELWSPENYQLGAFGGSEKRMLIANQLPAHSHSEPSLENILGLDQPSTASGATLTLKNSAVALETFTNNGTLTNTSNIAVRGTLINQDTFTNNNTINIYKNGELTNNGTLTNAKNSSITNNGILDTSNGKLINQGTISGSGTVAGHYIDQGNISPGNSTGGIALDGHFVKNKGKTIIELAGHKHRGMDPDKTKHDFLDIKGDAQLGGKLKVKLINDYILKPGKNHLVIKIDGTRHGTFKNYDEDDLIKAKDHAGQDLFISYSGGDGNDVVLYTNTNPSDPLSRQHDSLPIEPLNTIIN